MMVTAYKLQNKWKREHEKSLFKAQVPNNDLLIKGKQALFLTKQDFFDHANLMFIKQNSSFPKPIVSAVQGKHTLTLHVASKLWHVPLKI